MARYVLVTARHIVDPNWAKCGSDNPSLIFARINKKVHNSSGAPDFSFVQIRLSDDGGQLWSHHKDDDIDAAVIRLAVDISEYDTTDIPVELFPTDDELKIRNDRRSGHVHSRFITRTSRQFP